MNRTRSILPALVVTAVFAAGAPVRAQGRTEPSSGPAVGFGDDADSVKRLGKTVSRYKDEKLQMVVSSRYSARHLDRRWIFFDVMVAGLSGGGVRIHREDVSLETPDGTVLNLPSQSRLAEGLPDIRRVMAEARPSREPLDGYFPFVSVFDRLPFFAVPGEDLVRDEFTVNLRNGAQGDLFFESKSDGWKPGVYALVVRNKWVSARLPFRLPPDEPKRAADSRSVSW